jgi:hypothetical protein
MGTGIAFTILFLFFNHQSNINNSIESGIDGNAWFVLDTKGLGIEKESY